ncbi:MAG: hypothetical protein IPG01_14165 [Chitinophagaceae bacterium]|nr:hypothetical protein [Chitinophagaceae bacterium]
MSRLITKLFCISLTVIFFLLFVQFTRAQSVEGWKELVAGLPAEDQTAIEFILPAVKSIPGISYSGYCEAQRCLLLLFDPYMYAEPSQLVSAFANQKIKIYPKHNTTFHMMEQECTSPVLQIPDRD